MPERHLTVADLINSLAAHDPRTPVRLALSPEWPFEHYVGAITATPHIPPTTPDSTTAAAHDEQRGAVWIGDGGQIGHLPPEAWVELHRDPDDDLTGVA
ncbi:hypothetical protein OG455_34610 [Kitasatospora sp. NBC_01287]|uniref:hypothetical protein n=1 Tax=Kitasatospora sp. NBC_01287 TaxID=2903573 RepID=UPI00224F6541|nr:hypothetical protein [Kitasatospora sp. NBC_01287]MCX4750582.1 hypothetical protein [Kitasatospora sp. NBC_01287]